MQDCKVSYVQPCLDVCHVDARSIRCAARCRSTRLLRRLAVTVRLVNVQNQGAARNARLTGRSALAILTLKAACILRAAAVTGRRYHLPLPPAAMSCRRRPPLRLAADIGCWPLLRIAAAALGRRPPWTVAVPLPAGPPVPATEWQLNGSELPRRER